MSMSGDRSPEPLISLDVSRLGAVPQAPANRRPSNAWNTAENRFFAAGESAPSPSGVLALTPSPTMHLVRGPLSTGRRGPLLVVAAIAATALLATGIYLGVRSTEPATPVAAPAPPPAVPLPTAELPPRAAATVAAATVTAPAARPASASGAKNKAGKRRALAKQKRKHAKLRALKRRR